MFVIVQGPVGHNDNGCPVNPDDAGSESFNHCGTGGPAIAARTDGADNGRTDRDEPRRDQSAADTGYHGGGCKLPSLDQLRELLRAR